MFVGCFRCSKKSHSCREAGGQVTPVQTSGPTFLLLCPQLWAPTSIQAAVPRGQRSASQKPAGNLAITSTRLAPSHGRAQWLQHQLLLSHLPGSHSRDKTWPNCWPKGAWCLRGASQPQTPARPLSLGTQLYTSKHTHACMHTVTQHTAPPPAHTHTHTHWISFRNLPERSHPKYTA